MHHKNKNDFGDHKMQVEQTEKCNHCQLTRLTSFYGWPDLFNRAISKSIYVQYMYPTAIWIQALMRTLITNRCCNGAIVEAKKAWNHSAQTSTCVCCVFLRSAEICEGWSKLAWRSIKTARLSTSSWCCCAGGHMIWACARKGSSEQNWQYSHGSSCSTSFCRAWIFIQKQQLQRILPATAAR